MVAMLPKKTLETNTAKVILAESLYIFSLMNLAFLVS
jgi:hypothetical protein